MRCQISISDFKSAIFLCQSLKTRGKRNGTMDDEKNEGRRDEGRSLRSDDTENKDGRIKDRGTTGRTSRPSRDSDDGRVNDKMEDRASALGRPSLRDWEEERNDGRPLR